MIITQTRPTIPSPALSQPPAATPEDIIRRVLSEPYGPKATLQVVFQPVVDIVSGRTAGAEALARFRSEPYRTPDLWFSDAHRAGLGIALELRAIECAIETGRGSFDNRYVALNVSPNTLLSKELEHILAGVPGECIVLELTEHTRIDDYESIQAAIARYRSRGVRLAIDDAGAGYASFQHILRLRPDIIKLDRSLTSGVDQNPVRFALATAMVTFASSLGAKICAEGIETSDELVTLQQLGVRLGQGYYLARPAPLPLAEPPPGLWFSSLESRSPPPMSELEPRPVVVSPVVRSPNRLGALRATGLMDTASEDGFDRFTSLAAHLLKTPVAIMSLVDDRRQFFKSAFGIDSLRETPLSHSFCAHTVTANAPLVINDVRKHPLVQNNPVVDEMNVSAYAGVPIISDDNETIGAFCVVDVVPRDWTESDLVTLRTLSAMVTTHIQVRKRAAFKKRRIHILESVLEEADLSIILWALDGSIEGVNPAMCTFLGKTEEELLGTRIRLVHPDDRVTVQEAREELLGGAPRVAVAVRFRSADGSWVLRHGAARVLRGSTAAAKVFVLTLFPVC